MTRLTCGVYVVVAITVRLAKTLLRVGVAVYLMTGFAVAFIAWLSTRSLVVASSVGIRWPWVWATGR